MKHSIPWALLTAALSFGPAHAGLVFDIDESASGVTTRVSGSLSFDQGSLASQGSVAGGFVWASQGSLEVGPFIFPFGYVNAIDAGGPASFGTGGSLSTSTSTGNTAGFSIGARRVILPAAYVSGTALSGSTFYSGASFASLGLTPGTYSWTTTSGAFNDTIVLNVNVPTPATAALLTMPLLGVLCDAFRRRRRRD